MTGPPLSEGGVLVAGERIVKVGRAVELRRDAVREHHVEGVLLPGLVDGATQVELGAATALAAPGPYVPWMKAVSGYTASWSAQDWAGSARRGVHLLLRAGTTCAGDAVLRGAGVPAAARAGLGGTSWVEVGWVDNREHDQVVTALERTLALEAPGRVVGVCAASPIALGTGVLQALAELAGRADVPLHVRAARNAAEALAVREGRGPLADLATQRGMEFEWLDGGAGCSPVRYLDACGVLRASTSLAHGLALDDGEAELLAERGVTVVCTPRADADLRAGGAPLKSYADAGVALALGTTSPAISATCDVLAEARAWARLARAQGLQDWPGRPGSHRTRSLEQQALRLVTVDGARAMGWDGHAGVLAAGRQADLVGIELATTAHDAEATVVTDGSGRQVLTVVAGVRRARREHADEPWPALDELV
ncbi:MAG: amidohydrolase family protein [Egibacteraceae bacterium]